MPSCTQLKIEFAGTDAGCMGRRRLCLRGFMEKGYLSSAEMKCITISGKIIYTRTGAPFFSINEIIFDNKFDFSRFFVEK